MQVETRIQVSRDVGRYADCWIEVHLLVSGSVTETATEYLVELDSRLFADLWTRAEVETAKDALVAEYVRASLPFVLEAA